MFCLSAEGSFEAKERLPKWLPGEPENGRRGEARVYYPRFHAAQIRMACLGSWHP